MLASVASMSASPVLGAVLDFTHHQYRYTFTMSCTLATLALLLMLVVHKRFMALGGPQHSVAPE